MSETDRYLRHFAKAIADVYTATIVEALPHNVYVVERIDSQAKRYAKGSGFYRVGSWVNVQSASASGNVVGSMDTITTPAAERGLSDTTPNTRTETVSTPLLLGVNPDPLILQAGGDSAEQVIFGTQIATGPNYFAPDDGTDPSLTDAVAPIVTPTKITVVMSADRDSATGEFDVSVGDLVLRKVLRITAPGPLPWIPAVLVVGSNPATGATRALLFDPETLALRAQLNGPTMAAGDALAGGIVADKSTGNFYWIAFNYDVNPMMLLAVNSITGAMTSVSVAATGHYNIAMLDGIIYGVTSNDTAAPGLWSYQRDGDPVANPYAGPATSICDGGGGNLFVGESITTHRARYVTPAGVVVVNNLDAGSRFNGFECLRQRDWNGADGTDFGDATGPVWGTFNGVVRELDGVTLAPVATFGSASSGLAQFEDFIYKLEHTLGRIHKFKHGTGLTLLATLTATGGAHVPYESMAANATHLFAFDQNAKVLRKIDPVDGTVTSSAAVVSDADQFLKIAAF